MLVYSVVLLINKSYCHLHCRQKHWDYNSISICWWINWSDTERFQQVPQVSIRLVPPALLILMTYFLRVGLI